MRSAIALSGTAILLGVTTASAAAQDSDVWKPSIQAERLLGAFAACAVKRDAKPVRELLASSPAAPDAAVRIIRLLDASKCKALMGTVKMQKDVLRGALAQQVYVETYPDGPRLAGVNVPPVATGGDVVLLPYQIGTCAARRDPVVADALVRSARRSPQEATAARQLMPALNACASRAKFDFRGTQIHGVLAEGMLKIRGDAVQGMN